MSREGDDPSGRSGKPGRFSVKRMLEQDKLCGAWNSLNDTQRESRTDGYCKEPCRRNANANTEKAQS
jgi:hypothetical protein